MPALLQRPAQGVHKEVRVKLFERRVQQESHSGVDAVVQGNTEFALDLYQQLRTREGNLFFSPYSISTALAIAYAGARGETARQMARALHFLLEDEQLHPAFARLEARLVEVQEKGHVRLRVANSLWVQEGAALREEFLALTKQYYGVLIAGVDCADTEAARQKINAWVEEKTGNRIMELIPPAVLDPLTLLALVNAIYFKGDWASQFAPHLTRKAPFWATPRKQVQVMMMTQRHLYGYGQAGGLQILELPYAGEDLSMVVLLPRKSDGLARLEATLTAENLDRWTRRLRETQVEVFLPRFEVTLLFALDEILKSMGMVDLFSERADLTGMAGGPLFMGAVLHKAFVKVNEEGTEAAAVTAVFVAKGMRASSPPVFRADHPFLFLIREKATGNILFLGRVVDPASGVDQRASASLPGLMV